MSATSPGTRSYGTLQHSRRRQRLIQRRPEVPRTQDAAAPAGTPGQGNGPRTAFPPRRYSLPQDRPAELIYRSRIHPAREPVGRQEPHIGQHRRAVPDRSHDASPGWRTPPPPTQRVSDLRDRQLPSRLDIDHAHRTVGADEQEVRYMPPLPAAGLGAHANGCAAIAAPADRSPPAEGAPAPAGSHTPHDASRRRPVPARIMSLTRRHRNTRHGIPATSRPASAAASSTVDT